MKVDALPGLKISLRSNGSNLPEYEEDIEEDIPLPGSCFVEITAEATFSVHVDARKVVGKDRRDAIGVFVHLDGSKQSIIGKICDPGTCHTGHHRVVDIEGVQSNTKGGSVFQKFQFSALDTHDGAIGNAKKEQFEGLGTATMKCYWVRRTFRTWVDNVNHADDASSRTAIPEKCLKGRAISSAARLGDAQHVGGTATVQDIEYPYGKLPVATFNFKYRTRRDLQIEGIIERSPSPVPLEDRDPDDLTLEEARELLRRNREREAEQARIKQEIKQERKRQRSITVGADNDSGDEDEITITNTTTKRARHSNDSAIDIVDLTDA